MKKEKNNPQGTMVRLDAEQNLFVESLAEAMCSTKVGVLKFAVAQLRASAVAKQLLRPDNGAAAAQSSTQEGLPA